MLFLLIACAAAVYLWQHAPALLMLLGAGALLWYVLIPLGVIVFCGIAMALLWSLIGVHDLLHWLANALPDWRIFRAPQPDGLLRSISFQGWVAISMAAFVVCTLLGQIMLPR